MGCSKYSKKNLKSKHIDPYVSIDLRKESNSANHVSVLFFLQTLKMASNEGDRVNVPQEVSYIIAIIIGSDTYPFTVLLNLLVIMAVKTGPQLHLGGLFSSD